MCRRATAVLIVLFFMLIPSSVFADEGSLGGDLLPEAVNNPTVQRIGVTDTYFVYAPSNEFDVALAIIGETSTKIQLDTPKFTALSNESTGGDFYDLSQLCYSAEDGNPVNPANVIWYPMVQSKIALFGASHVWFCEATEEQISAARRDYLKVLEGGSLGSVASSAGVLTRYPVGDGYFNVYSDSVYDLNSNTITSSGERSNVFYTDLPSNIIYRYSSDSAFYNKLNSYLNNVGSPILVLFNVSLNYVFVASLNGVTYTIEDNYVKLDKVVHYNRFRPSRIKNMYDVNGMGYLYVDNASVVSYEKQGDTSQFDLTSCYYTLDFFSVGGGGGGGETNNWPDPTPIPKPIAPEVPWFEPGDPVTDPPDPIDITFSPVFVSEPSGTSPNDYTPWLRAILQALNTIIDDMATHCDHIRVAIRDWTQWLSQRIDYLMYEYLGDLQTYLHQLFEWLADEMSFNFEDGDFPLYDDSRLIAWLRRIYYQLGSPVNVNTNVPSDKDVEKGFDFWAWLLNLVNSLLGGIIEDFVGDVGGFLAELVGTFPFSVPWDILAYLTLLSAQRETPRIVVTIPAVSGWWSSYDVVIDCAPFDGAAAAVRSMVLIWWGLVLVMRTSWLDEIFRGATSLVTGFFDRVTSKVVSD